MPIVLAVNGVAEIFPLKPTGPRPARVEATDGQSGQAPPDRSILAAQSAYQEQARKNETPKRAIVARDLMTAPVVVLPSNSPLVEAWTVMQRKGFRHIPVTSMDGALVGIVSDRDLLHHAPDLVTRAAVDHAAQRRLAEIMTARVISATPTTHLRDIARVMLSEHIHAVPVLDANRRPIGILTSHNLLRGIAQHGPVELWT